MRLTPWTLGARPADGPVACSSTRALGALRNEGRLQLWSTIRIRIDVWSRDLLARFAVYDQELRRWR